MKDTKDQSGDDSGLTDKENIAEETEELTVSALIVWVYFKTQ